MEELLEAGHSASWDGQRYVVHAPTGIEIGTLEHVGDIWEWVEFTTEYDRGVETADRSFPTPAAAMHAMLEHGGWLV